MEKLKKIVKKYFGNFAYFYQYLRNKIFVAIAFNISVGILDGFGLAMFLPLLQMVDGNKNATSEEMGNLAFLVSWLEKAGIELTLTFVLCFIAAFFIFKGIASYFKGLYQVVLQQSFIKQVRIDCLNGLKSLSYTYFSTADVGRIQNTFTGEVDRVGRANFTYFQSMQHGVMVAVYMGFAFLIDYKFAVLVSIGGLLSNYIFQKIYNNTKGASRKLTQGVHLFQGLVIQAVANFKYLKATALLKPYVTKLIGQVEFIENTNKRIGVLGVILNSSREPLVIIVVCLVIFIQVNLLGSPLAAILISLLFFYRALNSLMQMQASWNIFLAVSGSLENMTEFTKELRENRERTGKETTGHFTSDITLQNISFGYGDATILKDINLTIKRNETIAFVGESGSGKTTLVNLVSGLLPPKEGTVVIDGKNRKEIDVRSFQSLIGYITQDPVIFNDTIYNNVTFWADKNPENEKRFWETLEKAAIADYVKGLPDKEDTELGNNGINLSGGQKQRVSIARELFKDIDLLFLDEATSALDSETEKVIQANIESLKGDYTILIVAHRLSTIKNADRIVLMNNGRIEQIGTYDHLLQNSDKFARMVSFQEI